MWVGDWREEGELGWRVCEWVDGWVNGLVRELLKGRKRRKKNGKGNKREVGKDRPNVQTALSRGPRTKGKGGRKQGNKR